MNIQIKEINDDELCYEHIRTIHYWLRRGQYWIHKAKLVKITEPEIRYIRFLRFARYCIKKINHHIACMVNYKNFIESILEDIFDIIKPVILQLGQDCYSYYEGMKPIFPEIEGE